jgi:hypothetical protein
MELNLFMMTDSFQAVQEFSHEDLYRPLPSDMTVSAIFNLEHLSIWQIGKIREVRKGGKIAFLPSTTR